MHARLIKITVILALAFSLCAPLNSAYAANSVSDQARADCPAGNSAREPRTVNEASSQGNADGCIAGFIKAFENANGLPANFCTTQAADATQGAWLSVVPTPAMTDAYKQGYVDGCRNGEVLLQQDLDHGTLTRPTANPAQNNGNGNTNGDITLVNPLGQGATVMSVLNNIFTRALEIVVVIVPIIIIVGAFQMMFAAGEPEKFAKGKKTILYAVIGLVIVLMAKGIIAIVTSILKV